MTVKSKSARPRKPEKPNPNFPLFPHATKRWAKKIRGKLHYFGSWADGPEVAKERFDREWPYLKEGRTPPNLDPGTANANGVCTIRTLCNAFLNSKRKKLESGEITPRTFRSYYDACSLIVEYFQRERRVDDLRPDDFEGFRSALAKNLGAVALRNTINTIRGVFKYAHDQRLVPNKVSYGQSFNRPNAKALRRARNEAGPRMFEADECRQILDALQKGYEVPSPNGGEPKAIKADPVMHAMMLLALNCGFGNSDVASLPQSAVDLDQAWIDFPRPKTEIKRRIPLWPETVRALRKAIKLRPDAVDSADEKLCFLTRRGRRWVRVKKKIGPSKKENEAKFIPLDALTQAFAKVLKALDINGRGFYALRHSFETIGGESRDQVAVDSIMGHVDNTMAGVYRERISDERLRAVVDVVHHWLWPQPERKKVLKTHGGVNHDRKQRRAHRR